jgi:hypothetical protein
MVIASEFAFPFNPDDSRSVFFQNAGTGYNSYKSEDHNMKMKKYWLYAPPLIEFPQP